jgi:hypothetical protein|tara:strand:- start:6322 stop:6759 length:438 start_codon:yes stop_codon:yes gene_type:complete
MFQVLGFIGSVLSASATIARGQEIKRQKEAEAAQIEQERFQRKIQTMEAHNDILDQLEEAEEQNEALYGFMNRDDDNSLNAFRRSQKDLANSDLKRVGFKGLAEQEQLRLRKLNTLRAGESAVRVAGLQAASTVLSGAMDYYKNS